MFGHIDLKTNTAHAIGFDASNICTCDESGLVLGYGSGYGPGGKQWIDVFLDGVKTAYPDVESAVIDADGYAQQETIPNASSYELIDIA